MTDNRDPYLRNSDIEAYELDLNSIDLDFKSGAPQQQPNRPSTHLSILQDTITSQNFERKIYKNHGGAVEDTIFD